MIPIFGVFAISCRHLKVTEKKTEIEMKRRKTQMDGPILPSFPPPNFPLLGNSGLIIHDWHLQGISSQCLL